jgi:hypothetical protein
VTTTRTLSPTVPDVRTVAPGHRPVRLLAATGIVGTLLLQGAMSAVGDTPDPHDGAASMAAYFSAHRADVLRAAPFGYLGAVLLLSFALALAERLTDAGQRGAATAVRAGGVGLVGYLVGLEVVVTSLAYQVAGSSAEGTKALFTLTILASPLFGLAAAALLGGAAVGGVRSGLLPRWWGVVSGLGALTAATAVAAFGDGGLLYPDGQQQTVFAVLGVWTLVTCSVLLLSRRARRP